MKIFRILVDLDEVLTDFFSAACRVHGIEPEKFAGNPRIWGMMDGVSLHYKRDITAEEFWNPIHAAGIDFWESLTPTPWSGLLISRINSLNVDWHIISAPSRSAESYIGKIRWLKKHLGPRFDRFAITPHKEIFSQPGVLLLDDRPANVMSFASGGGVGILFPTRGNAGYEPGMSDERRISLVMDQLAAHLV